MWAYLEYTDIWRGELDLSGTSSKLWPAFQETKMDFQTQHNSDNYWPAELLVTFQEAVLY